jgi:hypothetical protein
MAQFKDPRLKPISALSDPALEVMELVRLMLAESPYPVVEVDRRETRDRRLDSTKRALTRGGERRASTLQTQQSF